MALSDYMDEFGDEVGYPIGRRVRRRRPDPERRRRRLRRARGQEYRDDKREDRREYRDDRREDRRAGPPPRRRIVRRRAEPGQYRDPQDGPEYDETSEPQEAEVEETIEEVITEVLQDPNEEAAVELGRRLRRGWGPMVRAGNLRIQARAGLQAAILEVAPGLYCVAEVPAGAVQERPDEFGGPVKMATKITEAVRDAITRPQPVTVGQRIASRCKCRWERE